MALDNFDSPAREVAGVNEEVGAGVFFDQREDKVADTAADLQQRPPFGAPVCRRRQFLKLSSGPVTILEKIASIISFTYD